MENKKSCRTLRIFRTVGKFCGKHELPYTQELFLNCPYYENDGRDICHLFDKNFILNRNLECGK